MIEIFRRASALFLFCLGGYLMLWPGGKLLIVSLYEGSTIESQRITVTSPIWFELAATMTSTEGIPSLKTGHTDPRTNNIYSSPTNRPSMKYPITLNKPYLSP